MRGDEYKKEYKEFFYVSNAVANVNPGSYDSINKELSRLGANIRVGAPLNNNGRVCDIGFSSAVGFYMREKDITPEKKGGDFRINLEESMREMEEFFK